MLWSVGNEMLQKGALWVRHACLSAYLRPHLQLEKT